MSTRISGIGMTSQRTRLRMITRLREQATGGERIMQGHRAALLLLPAPTLTKAVTFFTAPPRINDCRT